MTRIQSLEDRGFDRSYQSREDNGQFSRSFRVGCSQCEALVINGIATHETGCPNGKRYECRECGQSYRDREDAGACCASSWDDQPDW